MIKLLIATPARSTIPIEYLDWLMPKLQSGQGIPGYEVKVRFGTGSSVNFGRNELAHAFMEGGYDEILFVDADMKPTEEQIVRLLSYDLDFVNGPYCQRKGGVPRWTFTPKPGTDRDGDLWEASAVGLGFARIKRCVFEAIREKFPEYEYFDPAKRGSKDGRVMFEYFPMGVVGPRTAQARLAKIKRILAESTTPLAEKADRVQQAAFEDQPRGVIYGEDYFFSLIAARCGFNIWMDMGMAPVAHIGNIAFPITPDQVGTEGHQEIQSAVLPL